MKLGNKSLTSFLEVVSVSQRRKLFCILCLTFGKTRKRVLFLHNMVCLVLSRYEWLSLIRYRIGFYGHKISH